MEIRRETNERTIGRFLGQRQNVLIDNVFVCYFRVIVFSSLVSSSSATAVR